MNKCPKVQALKPIWQEGAPYLFVHLSLVSMKRLLLLPFFLCTLSIHLKSQGRLIDSLKTVLKTLGEDSNKVKLLNEIGWKLTQRNNPDASGYAQKAKELGEAIRFTRGVVRACNTLGVIEMDKSNYRESLDYFQLCLHISDDIHYSIGQGNAYSNIGTIYLYLGNYPDALKNYLSALKIYEAIKDNSGIASTSNNMGGIYMFLGNYEEALKSYQASLKIKQKRGDKQGIANSLANIGGIYQLKKEDEKALEQYHLALKLYIEIEDKKGIATSYSNIGLVYADRKAYPDAIQSETQALAMRRKMDDKEGIATSCIHLAESEIAINLYPEAKKHLGEALSLALSIGNKEAIKNAYLSLSHLSDALHDFKEAFSNYKFYIIYRDSLNNEANTKKNTEARMQFEFDKKEALNNAEQGKKDVLALQEKQKQKYLLLGVIGVLIVVFLFSLFLYNRFKVTQRQKRIIEDQKEIVEQKNNIIEEKQKEILDSINYAKRIQLALLASENLLKENLTDHFVLFKPKDIVAGDFYWATPSREGFMYITADCTGHGVPGAFMSLLNISKLNEAINQKQITRPDLVLNDVRTEIIHALNPPGSVEESKDGMDCVLCNLNLEKMSLQFAAANDSLIVWREGTLIHCRADKMPVGKYTDTLQPFTYNEMELKKGDIIYTYTDGYADQFGGSHGKKFKYKPFEELLLVIARMPMHEQKEALDKAFENWKGKFDQVDDVCVMGVKI